VFDDASNLLELVCSTIGSIVVATGACGNLSARISRTSKSLRNAHVCNRSSRFSDARCAERMLSALSRSAPSATFSKIAGNFRARRAAVIRLYAASFDRCSSCTQYMCIEE